MRPQEVPRPRHLAHLTDDPRGYPVIATIGRGEDGPDFGSINELRKLVLATFDWCSVCGLPFHGDARWQVGPGRDWEGSLDEGLGFSEAPAHEICMVYAAHICPHLSSPGHRMGDDLRAGQHRASEMHLVGFRRTSDVFAHESRLQQDEYVLHFGHLGVAGEIFYSRPEDLADRYSSLLASEEMPELSEAESGLVELFNDLRDDNTITGAAVMAGAAFLKDVFKVQGMDLFAGRPTYEAVTVHLLDPRKIADFIPGNPDPASRLMCEWILERQENLPEVLAAWRQDGVKVAAAHGLTPSRSKPRGPGRTVPRNAPCPCGSGRKAGRCHPAGLPNRPQ